MGVPNYADISAYQGDINWTTYVAWARQFDGRARLALKASEGVGFTDPRFHAYRAGALAAGMDIMIYYHYARPDLGNSAQAEADYQLSVVGQVRAQDLLMLDYEAVGATATWAVAWLQRQYLNYPGKRPIIYASSSYIKAHLQDPRLADFPLVLAAWTYDPAARPACPPPWKSYAYWQYSDKAQVPGITTPVDINLALEGSTPMPRTASGENAEFISGVNQFASGGEMGCVAYAAALINYATQPGTPNHHTIGEVQALADKWFIHFNGSIISSNGMSEGQLHEMLTGLGLTYEPMAITNDGNANDNLVRQKLREGKLVVICAAESSFYDIGLGRVPYNWDSTPYNHAITGTGIAGDGVNVYVRDTAETGDGFPPSSQRTYDIVRMQYVSLTAVVPEWLKGGQDVSNPITLAMPLVASFYKDNAPNGWLRIKGTDYRDNKPLVLHGEILTYYTLVGSGEVGFNGLTLFGLPTTNEYPSPGRPSGSTCVDQEFERGTLRYDPNGVMGPAPGAGHVYALFETAIIQQNIALQAQLKTARDMNIANEGTIASLKDQLAAALANGLPLTVVNDITTLRAAITQLQVDAGITS